MNNKDKLELIHQLEDLRDSLVVWIEKTRTDWYSLGSSLKRVQDDLDRYNRKLSQLQGDLAKTLK